MTTLIIFLVIGIVIVIWIVREFLNAPLMPDDYEEDPLFYCQADEEEIKQKETDLINHHYNKNS